MTKFRKRTEVEAEELEAEIARLDDVQRRVALNKAVGMSPRCPWAFQLSEEELEQAEQDVLDGDLPIPLWTEPNGLRMLADPYRKRTEPSSGGWELLARVLLPRAGGK